MGAPAGVDDTSNRERIEILESLVARFIAASGGGSGGGNISVATLAALAATNGSADGQPAYVQSVKGIFHFAVNSPEVVDGRTVLSTPAGGTTRWIFDPDFSHDDWRIGITDVYIADTGTVEGTGIYDSVPGVPVPITPRELMLRWGRRNTITTGDLINLTFQIHVVGACTAVPLEMDFVAGTDTFPRMLGEANTVLLAGVLDAVGGFTPQTPAVPAPGGTPCSIKVGATVWGPFLGKRIRFTASGAVATILKDLGGGSARISQPQITNEPLFFATPTNFNPPNGAAFVVEDLVLVNLAQRWAFGMTSSVLGFGGQFNIADIQDPAVGGAFSFAWEPDVDRSSLIVLYQCVTDRVVGLAPRTIWNGCTCRSTLLQFFAKGGQFFGGAIRPGFANGAAEVVTGSDTFSGIGSIDFNTYIQGAPLICRENARVGSLAVFDAIINAINPGGHAVMAGGPPNPGNKPAGNVSMTILTGFGGGAAPIFGSGNAGAGLRVSSGSRVTYETLPNITGAVDLKLADSAVGWAWNPALAIYQPAGGIALTWASIPVAIGLGGFGGSAHELAQDAHLNKSAAT